MNTNSRKIFRLLKCIYSILNWFSRVIMSIYKNNEVMLKWFGSPVLFVINSKIKKIMMQQKIIFIIF